tara:strand:+ start:7672 stop:8061 length:390 start_codon:yes stop_codon:yes gene_type:complete
MATELNKAIHRAVELNGESYIVSLEPNPPRVTLRKKRHKNLTSETALADLLEADERETQMTQRDWDSIGNYKPSDIDYIHPSDLKMWAKYSYSKFNDAWNEYQSVVRKKQLADILWHTDGSIEIAIRPE